MVKDNSATDTLPQRYAYIRDVVHKYTRGGRHNSESEWEQRIDGLTPQQLQEIADVYRRIAREGDTVPLSTWIEELAVPMWKAWKSWRAKWGVAADQHLETPAEPQKRPREKELFDLFEYLRRNGVAPFASGEVEYSPARQLDWNKLPPNLRYLSEPAMKWGKYQFFEQRDELADKMTEAEFNELKEFVHRLRISGDLSRLDRWTSDYSLMEHPEAALVYWMLDMFQEFFPSDGSSGLYERRHFDNPFRELDELFPD